MSCQALTVLMRLFRFFLKRCLYFFCFEVYLQSSADHGRVLQDTVSRFLILQSSESSFHLALPVIQRCDNKEYINQA